MFIFNAGSVKTLFTFIVSKLYKPLARETLKVTPALISAEVYRSIVEYIPNTDDVAATTLDVVSIEIRNLVKESSYSDATATTLDVVSIEIRNLLVDLLPPSVDDDAVVTSLAVESVTITDVLVEHNNYSDVTNTSLQVIEVSIT